MVSIAFADRLHRAMLYVPADKERMLQKALALKPDSFIFDLEDAVAVEEKPGARARLASFFEKQKIGSNIGTWVRINNLDDVPDDEDIKAVVHPSLTGVVIPMASPKSIATADRILTEAEQKAGLTNGQIKTIALVETPLGIETIGRIIEAAGRTVGVQFGAEDFTLHMGVSRTEEGLEILYARQRIAVACRAYGVDAIDTPFTDFRDDKGLRKDAELVKSLGFAGKTMIHPAQIETVRSVFSPSKTEIEWAGKVIEAHERGGGQGAFSLDGAMVDRPIIMRAKSILEIVRSDSEGE